MKKDYKKFGWVFFKPFVSILMPLITIFAIVVISVTIQHSDRDKRIKIYTELSSIVSLLTPIILVSSLFATVFSLQQAYNNYQDNIEKNRKKSAFEYLNNITLGRFIEIRNELEKLDINPYRYREGTSYLSDRKKIFNPQEKLNQTNLIRDIFNTFDLICTGIAFGVIDEDMARSQMSAIMIAYWKWGKSFVLLARMLEKRSTNEGEYDNSLVYLDYEKQIYKWLEGQDSQPSQELDSKIKEWRNKWKQQEIKIEIQVNNITQSREDTLENLVKIIYETEYGFLKNS